MKELFHFYGCSTADVTFGAAVEFSINVDEWLADIDRVLLFLCKHANLPPEWIEAQDITRQNQLLRITIEMIEAQNATPKESADDRNKEWL